VTFRNCLMIAACGFFAAVGIALADTVDPGDPGIAVIGGDPPPPMDITTDLGNIQPNGNGNVSFDFVNNSGGIVDELKFTVTIDKGLSTSLVDRAFSISQGGAGYFLHDTVSYSSTTGVLTYDFFGVNPPDGDEGCHQDNEFNEQEGIPLCGVFHVTLTGWVNNASFDRTQLYSGLPTFTDSFADVAPEPSTVAFSGLGLLMLAVVVELRRRKAATLKG